MYIIKISGCYLGDKDKFVDSEKNAHKFKYKYQARDHATTFCLFHQWIDGNPIDAKILPFKSSPSKKR